MSRQSSKSRSSHITSGLTLILLGVLFLLINLDYLNWSDLAAYFLLGLGLILLVEGFSLRSSTAAQRSPLGKILAGIILIIIGAGNILGRFIWWPLILIVIGLYLLLSSESRVKSG